MTTSARAGLIALAALSLGIGLSACSSDTSGTASSASSSAAPTSSSSAQAAPPTSSAPPAPIVTLADYVRDNNIVETPVMPGDAGSPTVELPTLEGWEDMGSNAPEGSYSASVFTADPAAADPATVVTKMIKLTGNVDPAKVLEVAPGELRALPGFEGPESGQPNKLSGFDATVIGGTYTKDGAQRMVAQKTVAIPGQEGLYVLQINAEGTPEEATALMDATSAIDDQAKITP